MSMEKMREEFEAWFVVSGFGQTPEDLIVSDLSGQYKEPWVECAWQSWQASRESLVIELPQVVGYEAGYDSSRPNEYADQPGEFFDADEIFELHRSCEVRRAIEAQGVKVTP